MIYVYTFISFLIHLLFFIFVTIRILKKEAIPIEIEVKITSISKTSPLLSIENLKPGPSRGTGDKFDDEAEKNNAITEASSSDILNKKENKFYTYFERVRQQVAPLWIRSIQLHVGRKKLNKKYEVIIILAIFDRSGKVVRVLLVRSSGREGFDKIALDSMRDQTVPNPPDDLIDKDGYGRILWYFYIN